MIKPITVLLSVAMLASPWSAAQAHPGHSVEVVPPDSSLHYFVQPEHMMTTVVLGCAIVAIWLICKRPTALAFSRV